MRLFRKLHTPVRTPGQAWVRFGPQNDVRRGERNFFAHTFEGGRGEEAWRKGVVGSTGPAKLKRHTSLLATCASGGPLLDPTPLPSINLVRKLTGQWDP